MRCPELGQVSCRRRRRGTSRSLALDGCYFSSWISTHGILVWWLFDRTQTHINSRSLYARSAATTVSFFIYNSHTKNSSSLTASQLSANFVDLLTQRGTQNGTWGYLSTAIKILTHYSYRANIGIVNFFFLTKTKTAEEIYIAIHFFFHNFSQ